jgi:hypothetical protein
MAKAKSAKAQDAKDRTTEEVNALAAEWLESEKKELNLTEFKKLGEKIFEAKNKLDEIAKQEKAVKEEFEKLLNQASTLMQEAGLEKQHIPNYGMLYFKDYVSIPVPKEVSDKKALAKHFEKQGIFWEMFSVNSNTLRSYFNAERDKLEGDAKLNFRLAGCGEPTVMTKLETKRGK